LMDRSGIDLSVMIDSDRKAQGLSKEERIMQDQKWANLFNGTSSAVPFLPSNLRTAARTLFDSELFRTGDERAAQVVVNDWLEKSTVSFETKKADGSKLTIGALQKNTLIVDDQDATSWQKGQEILQESIKKIATAK